jgi:transposase
MERLMAGRTKRLWTDEEKRSICLQTRAPGVSVAQVARRYAMNANLIFKWLRDPRYTPESVFEKGRAHRLRGRRMTTKPFIQGI